MLKRAWFCVAVPWAVLMLWLASRDGTPQPGPLFVALAPLGLPWLLRLFFGFVISGGRPRP
jgi:hypothetical protein